MKLNKDLVKQFAKLTTPEKAEKIKPVMGTFKTINGVDYVQLDGSDILTPVITTVESETDERVLVQIENHKATVIGNITSPSARNKSLESVKSKVDEFGNTITQMDNSITQQNNSINQINNTVNQQNNIINEHKNIINSQNNTIQELNNNVDSQNNVISELNNVVTSHGNQMTSINNTIDQQSTTINQVKDTIQSQGNNIQILENDVQLHGNSIQAANSNITILNSGFKIVDGKLTGLSDVVVKNLKTNTLDTNYAEIDFANINTAAIKKVFADSGIIKDLIMSQGKVTGELVGVTIKGDLIEGNTIKADKLIIRGKDGLYYRVNVDCLGEGEGDVELDTSYQKGITGQAIVANSITAEKIAVDDLVAFDATIGGFIINNDTINSVNMNPNPDFNDPNLAGGVCIYKDGKFIFGNKNNYIIFDGSKLSMKTDEITYLNQQISDYLDYKTSIAQTIDGINVKIEKTGGNNLIYNSARYYSTDEWANLAAGYTDTDVMLNTQSKNAFIIGNNEAAPMRQQINTTKDKHALSFKYKILKPLSHPKVKVNDDIIELTETDDRWHDVSYIVDASRNSVDLSVWSDSDDSVLITDFMLNVGQNPHVWTSANGESINSGVKIGKGIEITSSESNIKQKIDNTGNRIINISTKEVVAEFTDKGTVTTDIEASSANLAKLIFKDIGDQTIITRI